MRGDDFHQDGVFSYISPETRIPQDHPLRIIRRLVDAVLVELSPAFDRLYARTGRPSVAPEKLLRALLLQVLYTVRSERLLMEQLDYNLLFRWFVGLSMDDLVWDATTFTKNRQRLLDGDMENRHGLVVAARVTPATGTAEREAGETLARGVAKRRRVTLGADKGYDAADFVAAVRQLRITPHVAQNTSRRASTIDGRTTRHAGYTLSQRIRKRVEEIFGWLKTIGLLRKVRHRGKAKVGWIFTFATAIYNLIRIRNLSPAPA